MPQLDEALRKIVPPIVIDPGHGGDDSGAVYGGVLEEDVNLKCALMCGHFLREYGFTTVFTRTQDKNLTDTYRSNLVNKGQFLISFHENAVQSQIANGLSVWYHANDPKSHLFANIVFDYINHTGLFQQYSDGVISDFKRYRRGFYMLRNAVKRDAHECALIEAGFLSNPKDRAVMLDEKKRNTVAEAVAGAVYDYVRFIWIPRYQLTKPNR